MFHQKKKKIKTQKACPTAVDMWVHKKCTRHRPEGSGSRPLRRPAHRDQLQELTSHSATQHPPPTEKPPNLTYSCGHSSSAEHSEP